MMAQHGVFFDPFTSPRQLKKKKTNDIFFFVRDGPPLTKLSGSAHVCRYLARQDAHNLVLIFIYLPIAY